MPSSSPATSGSRHIRNEYGTPLPDHGRNIDAGSRLQRGGSSFIVRHVAGACTVSPASAHLPSSGCRDL